MSTSMQTRIDSDDLSLADLFKDFYSVPDFQREYVWKEEHVEKLLQDVYNEFYDENKNISKDGEYFIGSIVTYKDGEGIYQLIDGQQRLTTSYLVLCVIRDYLRELGNEPSEAIKGQIADVAMDPRTGEDIHRYRLVLQYEDSQSVLEKIAAQPGIAHEIEHTTSSVTHILTAYQTIREFLQANFDEDTAKIKAFAAAYTMRVKLIRIVTPNLSSALKLFETINDRGVGLNPMDLLKNLLFMRTSKEEYAQLKDKWKELINILEGECHEKPLRFLRYYILSSFSLGSNRWILREDEIYTWFVGNQKETRIDVDPMGFIQTLISYAKAYAYFSNGKNVQGHEDRNLQNIALLSNQARQHFILLLAAQHLPEPSFTILTQKIENLFFCYLITRETTRYFERSFARWSVELRKVHNEEELNQFINNYLLNDMATHSNAFDFAFSELTTNKIQRYRLRYILAKICQYIDENALSKPIPLGNYYQSVEIEHILSQYPNIEIRNSFDKKEEYDNFKIMLGNLTLLEKSINASISNGSYEEKRAGYEASGFYLTQSLVQRPTVGINTKINRATEELLQFSMWNSKSIMDRQAMLGRLAREVWEIPQQSTGG